MNPQSNSRPIILWVVAIIALIFGALTLKSAFLVLFTTGTFHQEAGNYVPFVVWFNGFAGIFYLIAGFGLFTQRKWVTKLSMTMALATLLVFILFGLHIINGGLYEQQTIAAMSVRSGVWILISLLAWFKISRPSHSIHINN